MNQGLSEKQNGKKSQNTETWKLNIKGDKAEIIAKTLGVKEHKIVKIPLDEWGGSSLTDSNIRQNCHTGGDKKRPFWDIAIFNI